MFEIEKYIRKELLAEMNAIPVSEKEMAGVRLHKNENPYGSPLTKWYNRYPFGKNKRLREALAKIKSVSADQVLVANGTTHVIDTIYQAFCTPGQDEVVICPPTFSTYKQRALFHGVNVREVPLLDNFQLNIPHLETAAVDASILWLCSPNNPTGNALWRDDIETVLNNFNGLVVIDEAYGNFSRQKSFLSELQDYPNLILLQTLSIAWGLAGLQVSMAFGAEELVAVLEWVKGGTAVNNATEELCITALEEVGQVNDMIRELVAMREALKGVLEKLPFVKKVYPSDANFLLVKMDDARAVEVFLADNGIAVSNQSWQPYCDDCLRISIGTEEEITLLVETLSDYLMLTLSNKN